MLKRVEFYKYQFKDDKYNCNSTLNEINFIGGNKSKMPRQDGTGPRSGSLGPRDGRGAGQGRRTGPGIGQKKGGRKGSC